MDLVRGRWLERTVHLGVFFVVFGLTAVLTVRFLIRSGEDVVVPELVGRSVIEATAASKSNNLRLSVTESKFSDEMASGVILYQDVPARETVRAGRTVQVIVSKGPRERNAPRIVGMERGTADLVLRSSDAEGHDAGRACADGVPENTILAQDPLPGALMAGSEIQLLLSDGPCANRFVMPSLENVNYRDLTQELDRKGFQARFTRTVERTDLPPFTVISTEPAPGNLIHASDPLTFVIGTAPKMTDLRTDGEGRLLLVKLSSPPGFFRRAATLTVDRGSPEISSSIDFLLAPGENAVVALWVPPGAMLAWAVEGKQIWRRTE